MTDHTSSRGVVDDILRLAGDMDRISLGAGKNQLFITVHGLVMQTFEACRAALTLIDASQPAMVDAVARIALEHAVTVQWLCINPHLLDEYLQHVGWKQQGFIKALTREDFEMPEDVKSNWLDDDSLKKSTTLRTAEELFKAADAATLYNYVYRHLSTAVHPSEYTVTRYVNLDTTPIGFAQRQAPTDNEPVLWVLALSAVLAATAYTDLAKSKPFKAQIKAIASSGPVPVPCWLTPDTQPPKRRTYRR